MTETEIIERRVHRTILATMVLGVISGCIISVYSIAAMIFGPSGGIIALMVGGLLAARAIAIHTTWDFGEGRFADHKGEERKLLFIRAPSSVIAAMLREPLCEHQVMLSNRPTVEIPLVTLIVTCAEKEVLLPPVED